jgi:transcriptional regulator with XRE-family HTH domain
LTVNRLLMTLSEKIKALRTEKRFSVRGLAKEVSVTPMHISNLENNKSNASPELIKKIAIALGADADELLQLSSQVDPDVVNVINSNAQTIPSFLRSAKDLTPEQWEQLNNMVDSFKQ